MMNKAQADIGYGFTTIVRSDPRYYAYTLMNNALGQYGIGGRLGDSIRERQGMAYYVFSSFDANVVEGPLIVRAGVNPANVDRAIGIDRRRNAADGCRGHDARRARRLQAVFDRVHSAAARDQRRDCDVPADGGVLRARARPRSPAAVAARCGDARRRERRRAADARRRAAPQSSSPVRINDDSSRRPCSSTSISRSSIRVPRFKVKAIERSASGTAWTSTQPASRRR